jgi:glyoxylase-like metal-dependent hydrolase (beta-lactamase superfamily II)
MIEEILSQIYKIEIPLPNSPLKALNSYFIKGKDRNLLIDTGFNQPECRAAMDEGIRELGFSMETTDILVTHVHGDHSGLVHYLATPTTKVFCDSYTAKAFEANQIGQWGFFREMIAQGGLGNVTLFDHPGYKYKSESVNNIHIVKDGDNIQVGEFEFQCISTPGHAPDHICLYEDKCKILFSGDHILGKITPNNTLWDKPWTVTRDLLEEYLKSLDKIACLNIEITLPAHRHIINDCYSRIQELKDHHQARLNDILNILGHEKMYGAQVASKMKWDMRNKTWEEFAITQKIFATGEALAHLNHLVCKKVLVKELCKDVVYYSMAK